MNKQKALEIVLDFVERYNKQDKEKDVAEAQEVLEDNLSNENEEWVSINYNVIPKEIFDKYGSKPFQIMKRKMRDGKGEVWNNINYFDAQKECKKLGYRLPTIQEMLVLLEWYKAKNEIISSYDKEFLGIEELSYKENVYYEWIEMNDEIAFRRGGNWGNSAPAGVFTLYLDSAPTAADGSVGFRCAR